MKIEGTPTTSTVTGAAKAPAAAPSRASAQGAGGKDSVSISAKSSQLQSLESSIKDSPDVDIEKIETIKKAIMDGSFSISSGRVAEKMIASARELLNKS